MTGERLPLAELLAKAGDGDFLHNAAYVVVQLLMETDVEGRSARAATSDPATARRSGDTMMSEAARRPHWEANMETALERTRARRAALIYESTTLQSGPSAGETWIYVRLSRGLQLAPVSRASGRSGAGL